MSSWNFIPPPAPLCAIDAVGAAADASITDADEVIIGCLAEVEVVLGPLFEIIIPPLWLS